MCSIVVATRPQGDGHTIWPVLSVVSLGCTDNPLSGMKPASDLSSHKGTDAAVAAATGNKGHRELPSEYYTYSILQIVFIFTAYHNYYGCISNLQLKSFKIVTMILLMA